MPDFDFDGFLDEVGQKLTELANETAGEFRDDAIADGKAFIEGSRARLERWTTQLAAGELSLEDFTDLLEGEKDLAELALLKRTVITKVQLNRFKDGLVGVITSAVATQLGGP